MTFSPKTAHWRTFVPNSKSLYNKTIPYLKIQLSHLLWKTNHSFFWWNIFFNMLQYPYVHSNLKNTKEFSSEIFKHTRSEKPDMEEAPQIEGCVNTNIQEK